MIYLEKLSKLTQYGIYTPVILGIICDLSVFSLQIYVSTPRYSPNLACATYPDSLSTSRHHPQFRNIHFNDCSLRHDTELCIHWRLRVLLHTYYR